MSNTILLPLDGSELAERALGPALALAKATGGDLFLLRVAVPEEVLLPDTTPMGGGAVIWRRQATEQSLSEARAYLDRFVEARLPEGVPARVRVIEGPVAEGILSTAANEGAGWIVMSSHGYSGFTRWLLGSVAERVLQAAPCPVLVVRDGENISRVLIPLDGSKTSELALQPGYTLACALGCPVTLLRSLPPLKDGDAHNLNAMERGLSQSLMTRDFCDAEDYLDQWAEVGRDMGLKVHTTVTHDPPAKAILTYAETHNVGVIAMATHGRSGLRRWLYGSVTEKVLRGSQHSMLIVRPSWQAGPWPLPAEAAAEAAAETGAEAATEKTAEAAPPAEPGRPPLPPEGLEAALERAFIELYLRDQGHTTESVRSLPEPEARRLMAQASAYASTRLAEVQTRAHLVHDLETTPSE